MSKIYTLASLSSLLLFSMLFVMCKKEYVPKCDGTASTYDSNMKEIITSNCSSASCHPTFTNYAAISKYLSNGEFKKRVLVEQDMPRGSKLSKDQLNKIQCWADAGFPEK